MGEPFVDGPISPNVDQMFSEELFGARKEAGEIHGVSGNPEPGSHFKEELFGARTRRRDLVKGLLHYFEAEESR
jgi:hypothetical protein